MKQPKKLIRTIKERLRKMGFNENEWMLADEDKAAWLVIKKDRSETMWVAKN